MKILCIFLLFGSLQASAQDDGGSAQRGGDFEAQVPTELLQKEPSEPSKSASDPAVQQTAIEAPENDFVFDPTGLRDPFKPYKTFVRKPQPVLSEADRLTRKKEIELSELQSLDLSTVQLVAVVWDTASPRAMIRTRGGSLHTLRRNTKVGRNNGVVAAIREGEVVILESIEEDQRVFKQYVTLKMKNRELKDLESE